MNAPVTMPTIRQRIARCRTNLNGIRELIGGIRHDLECLAAAAPSPSLFELDLARLAEQFQALADHAREITDTLKRRREDGIAADQRIDALIAGTVQ